MKRIVIASVLAFTMAISGTAKGSIEGFSILNISNFQLFVDSGGGAHGAAITNGVQVSVPVATFSSAASADVTSIPGISSTTATPDSVPNSSPVVGGFGLNTRSAYQGPLLSDPPQNTFANLLGALPHAHADTTGDGAIIAGLGVLPPADSHSIAEVDLSTSLGSSDSGRADSSTTSTASFFVTVIGGAPLAVVGDFLADKLISASLTSAPPGVAASADTSFNISIDATDLTTGASLGTVFTWSPNGLAGGITGGTEYLDPFDLNASVSTFPGFASSSAAGPSTFRAGFTLLPGIGYTFNVESSSAATARSVGVVPEPASMIVWSVIGVGVGSVVLRRRHKSA